jgi:hypothetical protein
VAGCLRRVSCYCRAPTRRGSPSSRSAAGRYGPDSAPRGGWGSRTGRTAARRLRLYAGQGRVKALNPVAIVEALKGQGTIPRLDGVSVEHVGVGHLTAPRCGARSQRRPPEVPSLEATWSSTCSAAGVTGVTVGRLPVSPTGNTLHSGAP